MLTPITAVGKTADGHIKWRYQCDCGNTTEVAASRVRNGYTRSCGCLVRANMSGKTHGMKNTPTYSSWCSAKDRATNPNSKDFHRYGAVGIGMAERWLTFKNFFSDMGVKPLGTSIDRINPARGYEPGNCRWATPIEQARNKTNLVIVRAGDEVLPLVDYAKSIGITRGAAHLRLKRGKLAGVHRV
jgi:hypothetical protein